MLQVFSEPSHCIPLLSGSFHPETPDVKLAVSDVENGDFSCWQENQGIARRRTKVTPHKQASRLTPPGRKSTFSGRILLLSIA